VAKQVSEFEDEIDKAKEKFRRSLNDLLSSIRTASSPFDELTESLTAAHAAAVAFFNLFERSINEFGLDTFKLNEDTRIAKSEDAVAIAEEIVNYWNVLNGIRQSFNGLIVPEPTKMAYSSIQRVIANSADKTTIDELKTKFIKAKLPVGGFAQRHSVMTKKQQVTYSTIAGTIFIIVLLAIAILIDCPTEAQARIFNVVLALAAASFAAAIPGFIQVQYNNVITAGGALAVFVIVFVLKPADLSDLSSCQKYLEGNVMYGSSGLSDANINLVKQNQYTTTNGSGNFALQVDFGSIDNELKVNLKKDSIQLDTTFSIKREELQNIEITVKQYCAECEHTNSSGEIVRQKRKCSTSKKYIQNYIKGFTKAGDEQHLTTNCKTTQQ
jgi:hypothetical protein